MVTEVSVTCRLCENTFLKPRVVPCCNIKCCYQCLQSLEDDNKGCPVCGTSFKTDSLKKCEFIEGIIAKIKPAVLMSQILDDYAKYPHLQTSVVKREMRNALMGCVEMDEKISFFIKYQPNVAIQSLASSSRSSPSSPPEIEHQLQNIDNIKPFNRGYRCLATTPISTIRQMMVQKFQIDESVAKVVFYNSGAVLADCITLRTVAFRMNSPEIRIMTIDMLLMPKLKPQKPSTSSSIEGVNTEDVKKKESEADKAAEKLEEGPPVLEEETMPSLDAETPQLGQEPTPPPPSVEEAKTDSPTITTIVPLVNTPPKHMPVGQVMPMQFQPQMHRTPPNLVAQPMVMHRTPPNLIQQPLMKHRAPPNMLQQSTPRCVNVEKLKPLPLTFNQAATSQVVELLFLRAMEKRIEPSKFLECYYSAADGPPLHRKLTPEEKQIYDFRRKCDAQGAFIPTISPENQATLYHQMFDKRIQVMDEERAKKRRSIETAQDGTKRLKKTEVSAYVVSTPIMHKPPPPLPSTPSSSSSTSSVSSLPGPSMIDEKPILIKPKQELPIAICKTEQPSPLATPTNAIDALTLSRQCSKTLGKTLAESMRRSGGNSSKPSFMLPQNPPPTINITKLVVPVDEKPRVGPV